MSFIIALYIGEGLVMASDSRITYNSNPRLVNGVVTVEQGVHFTNSTPKTFVTQSNVGISYCGDSSIKNKPITGYIESFIEAHKNDNVDAIKDAIVPYFTALEGNLDTSFIIGGYMSDGNSQIQKLYRVNTKGNKTECIDTSTQGAIWSGVTDVMVRVLNPVFTKSEAGNYTEVVSYPILWQYFTLQDAIDFARYAVRTTIDTMNFQRRVKTVGGSIDILVIKPTEAIWIEKRRLH